MWEKIKSLLNKLGGKVNDEPPITHNNVMLTSLPKCIQDMFGLLAEEEIEKNLNKKEGG